MEDDKRAPFYYRNDVERENGDSIWRGLVRGIASPTVLALTLLAGLSWWLFPGAVGEINPAALRNWKIVDDLEPGFSWNLVQPSKSLEYHDCFDGYQCARLDVPMDYHRTDGQGSRMSIAVTRLPAKVLVTDPRYGGAILVNPGGPGGSGVAEVLLAGHDLQTIVDASVFPSENATGLYYDVIGFDPRGVNNTTPGFNCFPNLFSQKNWELQAEADGMLGSSANSFMRNWQRALALNAACAKSLSGPYAGGDILGEHTNTLPVARDMLEIVERHGQWREKQGIQAQKENGKMHGFDQQQTIHTRTKWRRGHEKLLYWGRSYGTVLGSTFATLFPDRVERMVLDGVVDAEKYYTGVGPDPIADADAIFDKFASYCDAMGEACPFHVPGGPAAIKSLYRELENGLYNTSMAVMPTNMRGPDVITWTDLKNLLRWSMYQPLFGFGSLATTAGNLLEGNGSSLADVKHNRRSPSCPTEKCLLAGPWSTECEIPGQNEMYATSAILCLDADYMQDLDEEHFKAHWHALQNLSSVTGDYWAHTRLNCVGWGLKAKWNMTIPVSANTSFPLLFVNNILDPVTPLASAKKMNQAFPGSVLIQQDSEGHCTIAAPSTCISLAIRKYFQTGELPPPGTLCEADLKPMLGAPRRGTVKEQVEPSSFDKIALQEAMLRQTLRMRRPVFPL